MSICWLVGCWSLGWSVGLSVNLPKRREVNPVWKLKFSHLQWNSIVLLYLICRRDKLLKKLNVPLIEKNQKRQNQASASAIGVTLPMTLHPEGKKQPTKQNSQTLIHAKLSVRRTCWDRKFLYPSMRSTSSPHVVQRVL